MEVIPVINLILILILLGAGVHFYIQSRNWTIPLQDIKVEKLSSEISILSANVSRIEKDIGSWRREGFEINEALLKDLNLIKHKGTEIHFLREKLLLLEHRVDSLEQGIEIPKS